MKALLVATLTSGAISAAQADAIPTFAEAVEAHQAMVYSILWHFLHDRSLAEELAQDVFLELHTKWASMKSARHILFWLRKVATHRAIDSVRKRKTRPETSLDQSNEPTPLERVHDTFLSSYLARIVASLPEKQRAVIVLRYQEEMELKEIAEILGIKIATVKTQLFRALEFLRAKTAQRLGSAGSHDSI